MKHLRDYEDQGLNHSFGAFLELYRKTYPGAAIAWGRDELRHYLALESTRTIESAVTEARSERI